MKGMFEKNFDSFKKGLKELMSFESAQQALTMDRRNPLDDPDSESSAVAGLAINVANDRPTGNGVDWGRCSISINADRVIYQTTGGLSFGWSVDHRDYQSYREYDETGGNKWRFFISHPLGENIPESSTLRKKATELGWQEN